MDVISSEKLPNRALVVIDLWWEFGIVADGDIDYYIRFMFHDLEALLNG